MKIKVETEKKYYCIEPELLQKKAIELGFKEISKKFESDEYFTDLEFEFIRNRTCLRIRKNENINMEITFKGKSTSLLNSYCKLENNIKANIDEYDNYVNLFSSLGFYSYVNVGKNRITYQLEIEKYVYNIMIDQLDNIGGFVEFEIIADQKKSDKNELLKELNDFVSKFESLNLKEANDPYRDIVAKRIYNDIKNVKNNSIYINVDDVIEKYEKDFFRKYKDEISKKCNNNIGWIEFKKNPLIENKIEELMEKYLSNLVFVNNQLLTTINLLNKMSYEKYFVTKTNKTFFKILFKKMDINTNNTIYLQEKNLAIYLKANNIDINKQIIIDKFDIKQINSILMIIINNS